jgi:hypothetical protein
MISQSITALALTTKRGCAEGGGGGGEGGGGGGEARFITRAVKTLCSRTSTWKLFRC